MTKCVLCGKARAENEMRPLINVDELAVGNALSDADKAEGVEAEREVGGATLQIVCRPCWHVILESKEKAAVIEMLETLCGLLFEVERRRREERQLQLQGAVAGEQFSPVIEKQQRPQRPWRYPQSNPVWQPTGVVSSTTPIRWCVGGSSGTISLTSGGLSALGNQWDTTFGTGSAQTAND